MKTIQEATTYIIESMKNVDDQETFDDVDEDIVQDQIIEGLLDKVETELDQDDLQTLDERSDDAIFVGEFLQRRFPNFEELLEKVVENILSEYLVDTMVPTTEE